MKMSYGKGGTKQQYALRKKIKSTVQSKVKKNQKGKTPTTTKRRQTVLKAPKKDTPAKKLPPGFKAKVHYKSGKVKITADVRYETEKTDPLIKVKNIGPKGEIVHKRFIGPKKEVKWFDEQGNEVAAVDVQTAQMMPDGTFKPVSITRTKDIKVDPVDAEVANDFLPYSYLELWGETDEDTDGLREVSADLMKQGKVGAIKEFSHGRDKMYVGFLRPTISKDGKQFGIEVMLAENRRKRRRWMLAEPSQQQGKQKAQKTRAPTVPQLW